MCTTILDLDALLELLTVIPWSQTDIDHEIIFCVKIVLKEACMFDSKYVKKVVIECKYLTELFN